MSTKTAEAPIQYQWIDPEGRPNPDLPSYDDEWLKGLLRHMLRARCVDERMMLLQRTGKIAFVGPAVGMEGAVLGSASALEERDWLWSGLREGSAAVMRGMPLSEYIGQMFGNTFDTSKGRQMASHFQHKGTNFPSWSSVIGTQVPHGAGAAYASKLRGEDSVHAVYLGDGATSANGFHSGLNFAAVWKVPAVFVVMVNGWAISVPSDVQTASDGFAIKGEAYGVPSYEVDGNDPLAAHAATKTLVERARAGEGPSMLVLNTYRLLGHSSADDPTKYRPDDEVADWEKKDPIARFERFLVDRGLVAEADLEGIRAEALAEVDEVIQAQKGASDFDLSTLIEDTLDGEPQHLVRQLAEYREVLERRGPPALH